MQSLSTATSSSRKLSVYYLLNPSSGANTVQVNLGVGTSSAVAVAESFSNVATMLPVATTATGASGSPSVAVTGTSANDLVVDFVSPNALTAGAGH
jgi:hypothetical protein